MSYLVFVIIIEASHVEVLKFEWMLLFGILEILTLRYRGSQDSLKGSTRSIYDDFVPSVLRTRQNYLEAKITWTTSSPRDSDSV